MSIRKDLRPNRLDNTIHGKLFIPQMELYANFESILTLLMWPTDAKGVLNFNMSMYANRFFAFQLFQVQCIFLI